MLRAKLAELLLLAMAGVSALAQSDSSGTTMAGLLQAIPECALPCVLTGVQSANCSLTDVTALADCLCTNLPVQSNMSTCVQTSCQFDDQVAAVNVQSQLCAAYPKESRVTEVKNAAIASIAIALPIVVARCAARFQIGKTLWLDDWMSIAATIFLLAVGGIEIASAVLGFGLHYWNVNVNNATVLLQLFYSAQIFYIMVQVFAKVAILVLYARVFSGTRWVRLTVKGGIAFMFGHGLIFILVIIFQCRPVHAIWDRSINGQCINVNAVGYVGAVLAVVEDIVLILLPIPDLWKLQLAGRKRVGLVIMFTAASIATVASMVRLKYIIQFSKTFDTTWDNVDIVVWSLVELLCAVACGSLPSLRPWFGPLIPGISSWRKGGKSSQASSRARGGSLALSSKLNKSTHSYPMSPLASPEDRGHWKEIHEETSSPRRPEPAASGQHPAGRNQRRRGASSGSSENNLIIQDGANNTAVISDKERGDMK